MFENIARLIRKLMGKESKNDSKEMAKERLHLVLMQDRANVSADFLEMMKQEIIEVIKKYIDVDENAIDVRLTNKSNEDGTNGAPALYANIPIISIKEEAKKEEAKKVEEKDQKQEQEKQEEKVEEKKEDQKENKEQANENVVSEEKETIQTEEKPNIEEEKTEETIQESKEEVEEKAEETKENKIEETKA